MNATTIPIPSCCNCKNGWLLYTWNARPREENRHEYLIMGAISKDQGETWEAEQTIYPGREKFSQRLLGAIRPATAQWRDTTLLCQRATLSPKLRAGDYPAPIVQQRNLMEPSADGLFQKREERRYARGRSPSKRRDSPGH